MDKPHRHGETLQRDDSFDRLTASRFDVVVVGGGINGAVAALSLSAHGLKVGIVEADDFASLWRSSIRTSAVRSSSS